jgi:hypothetical protein
VIRVLVAAGAIAGALLFTLPAQATTECRGLQACVPVVGPWVVVPVSHSSSRPAAQWQLTCPKGYIVAGVDAQLTTSAIDISFIATPGTPVAPGRTTARAIVFVATYVGIGSPTAVFRPRAGCIPGSGGGGRRTPTAIAALVPPGKPTVRRVKNVHVDGTSTGSVACRSGERLVGSYATRGFRMAPPPAAGLVQGFTSSYAVRANRVSVHARSGDIRAVVQIAAVCAGGK